MRFDLIKYLKVASIPFLLVTFIHYTTNVTSPLLGDQDGRSLTLVLSADQAQTIISGQTKASSSGVPENEGPFKVSIHPAPKKDNMDFVVINNKVYDKSKLDELLKVKTERTWPVTLNASSASALLKVNFKKYSKQDAEILEDRVGEMVSRARQVNLACNKFYKIQNITYNTHLLWDQKHQPGIVWCPNYKVASTTWMINFLRLAHFNENNPAIRDDKPDEQYSHSFGAGHNAVFKYYPTPPDPQKPEILKKSLRLIIVRHPFTRLLSAYRDKMTKMHPLPGKFHFRKLQVKIISQYRPTDSSNKSPFPTFPEFIQYVIDTAANLTTTYEWKHAVKCWMPYWVQCNVCTLDYNVIMKLETMVEDESFIVTLSRLNELKKLKSNEWRHRRNETESVHDVKSDYFSQLTKKQMVDIYNSYRLDFEAFGYNIDNYLTIAKDAEGREGLPTMTEISNMEETGEQDNSREDNSSLQKESEKRSKKMKKKKKKKHESKEG